MAAKDTELGMNVICFREQKNSQSDRFLVCLKCCVQVLTVGPDFEGLKDIPGYSDFIMEQVSRKMFKQGER